jgi:A/G-specific adenine glycosylase
MNKTHDIAQRLLDWYGTHARDLPWRRSPDGYTVWVAEIMLQQTRMQTVLDYYRRWMELFPSLEVLAQADLQQVLQVWEGLGYYTRARNLHRAAQVVMEQYGGVIATERKALERLPGIGRYTAAMIASVAYGKDEAALDGNIRRVYARLFNLEEPLGTTTAEKTLWAMAEELLPPGRAGDYNQALMDFGSAVCTPQTPACDTCPLNDLCAAYRLGVVAERPLRQPKKDLPRRNVAAAIIEREDGRILLAQRPTQGLYGGLWEFPGGKQEPGEVLPQTLQREIAEELGARILVGTPFGVYEHTLTHFHMTLHAFLCHFVDGDQPQALEAQAMVWVLPGEMEAYPMAKVDRQIASELMARLQQSTPSENG